MKLSKDAPVDQEEAAEASPVEAPAETEAPQPPPVRTTRTRESCRHVLTIDQLLQAGREMAETQNEVGRLEEDFKSVRDDWKAKISSAESRLTNLSGRISRGYDMKDTECTVYMDTPEEGLKTCLRNDTGEKVWVQEMTGSDKQLPLPLDDEPEAPAAAAPVETPAAQDTTVQVISDTVKELAKENGVPAEKLLAALIAINGGANTVTKLQAELKIGYTAAAKLYEVAKLAGAPEPMEGGAQ